MSDAGEPTRGTCNMNGQPHVQTCGCIDWTPFRAPVGESTRCTECHFPESDVWHEVEYGAKGYPFHAFAAPVVSSDEHAAASGGVEDEVENCAMILRGLGYHSAAERMRESVASLRARLTEAEQERDAITAAVRVAIERSNAEGIAEAARMQAEDALRTLVGMPFGEAHP